MIGPDSAAEQVRRFAQCIFVPDDIVEVRCILPREHPDFRPEKKPLSKWSRAADLHTEELAGWMSQLNSLGYGVYVGANPRQAVGGRDGDSVALARCLFADFDGSATVEQAIDRVRAAGLPEPRLVLASGHGVHVYWLLDEPMTNLDEWSLRQSALISVLNSDPAIKDPPRVMRLPGFVNTKPPQAQATLISYHESLRYPLATFPTVEKSSSPVAPRAISRSGMSNYAKAALDREAAAVTRAQAGARNTTLNTAAFKLGTLVGAGELNEDLVRSELAAAARACGLPDDEADSTITSGLESGKAEPRPPRSNRPTVRVSTDTTPKNPMLQRVVSVSAWQPFPSKVLPPVLAEFVEAAGRAIGCDPSLVALPVLGVAAASIGNTRRIRLKESWTEPTVIWATPISESGTQKSPGFFAATEPLSALQRSAFKKYNGEMGAYRAAQIEYKAAMADWRKEGRKAGEPQPEAPEEPVCERFIVQDTTIEALADRLLGARRGLLLARDEIDGWWKGFDQYRNGKGGDVAHWLSIHGARDLLVDRKTGDKKTLYIPRAAVSIVGGIQPGTLRRSLAAEHFENGMMARILTAMPPRRRRRWTDAEINKDIERHYHETIQALLALQPGTDDDKEPTPRVVGITSDGMGVWVEFYDQHAGEQMELSGDLSAAWSKLEGYAARLALIVHEVRLASGDRTVWNAEAVDEQSMIAGIALSRWFGNEAKRVYAMLSESEEEQDFRRRLELLQRRGGSVTVRDWQRARGIPRADQAEAELREMVEAGALFTEPVPAGPKGGQPTVRFHLRAHLLLPSDTDTTPEFLGDMGVVSDDRAQDDTHEAGGLPI